MKAGQVYDTFFFATFLDTTLPMLDSRLQDYYLFVQNPTDYLFGEDRSPILMIDQKTFYSEVLQSVSVVVQQLRCSRRSLAGCRAARSLSLRPSDRIDWHLHAEELLSLLHSATDQQTVRLSIESHRLQHHGSDILPNATRAHLCFFGGQLRLVGKHFGILRRSVSHQLPALVFSHDLWREYAKKRTICGMLIRDHSI